MALIWDAESMMARTVCQVPQWSRIWTRAVPNSTADESSALDGIDVAHKEASPLDGALSDWPRVERP